MLLVSLNLRSKTEFDDVKGNALYKTLNGKGKEYNSLGRKNNNVN